MPFVMVLVLAAGAWIAVVLFVVSLCGTAKWADDGMDMALENAMAGMRDAEAAGSAAPELALRTLSLDEAAALLGIDPHTLLAWEARYGFPTSSPSESHYSHSELLALRDGLRDGASIASAVARARVQTRRRRSAASAPLGDRRGGGLAS
jgi:hypothetical protein